MTLVTRALALAVAGSLTAACVGHTAVPKNAGNCGSLDSTELRKVIDEKHRQFGQAHIDGNIEYLNNIFASDGRFFAPNADVATGSAAIAAVNAEFIGYGIKEFTEDITALYGSGDYLIDEGTYTLRYGKDNTIDKGKYVNIWKRVGGDWKMFSNRTRAFLKRLRSSSPTLSPQLAPRLGANSACVFPLDGGFVENVKGSKCPLLGPRNRKGRLVLRE